MTDTPNIGLTYLEAAQSQKHVTVNEAFRDLDVLVQPVVLDKDQNAPPGSPAEGDSYIIPATGAVGAWSTQAKNIAAWRDGGWLFFVPKAGWTFYVLDEAKLYRYSGTAWAEVATGGGGGTPVAVSDEGAVLTAALASLNITGPSLTATAVGNAVTLTFAPQNGQITQLGVGATADATNRLTVLTPSVLFNRATNNIDVVLNKQAAANNATLSYKTNFSTRAIAGLNGADAYTVNVSADGLSFKQALHVHSATGHVGLAGATADATNALSIYGTNVLMNSGGSIDLTYNKNAAANDASLSFKTGFSARAAVGTLGDDNFHIKVSPDGSTFIDALVINRFSGHTILSGALRLTGMTAPPTPPANGTAFVYGRTRAGATWIDVMRPSGRDFPLQPHIGYNRVATWVPQSGTSVVSSGMLRTAVGTTSTPNIAATNLSTAMRRWRVTSAATAGAAAEERAGSALVHRGNVAGVGGFTYVNRLSLTTVQADSTAFFGLLGTTGALSTTAVLTDATFVNAVGIGFSRATDTNWQIIHNDASGAPTQIDLGANFPINTTNVYTVVIGCSPGGGNLFIRVVNDNTGDVFETELTTDVPGVTTFLNPRNYINNGATAAVAAYDCSGVYVETDY